MPTRTVRVAAEDDVAVIIDTVRSLGGSIAFHPDSHFGRRYGTLEGDVNDARVAAYDTAIIAVAVTPSTPEALPLLESALLGAGCPVGVLACERIGESLVVEWDVQRASIALLFAILDVELARLHASRHIRILTPICVELVAQIAADGLHAPELCAERVLEVRLRECGVDV